MSAENNSDTLSINIPSLQIDYADSEDDTDEDLDRDGLEMATREKVPISVSYLKPPPTCHTLPRRSLIILSPISPNKRYN